MFLWGLPKEFQSDVLQMRAGVLGEEWGISGMSKSTRRAKWALVGVALALVPALLLVFEVGTRMLRPHLDPLEVFISSPQLRQDTQGENTKGMFEFDPLLTWKIRPKLKDVWWDFTSVSTNSRGIRMERDIMPKKPGPSLPPPIETNGGISNSGTFDSISCATTEP